MAFLWFVSCRHGQEMNVRKQFDKLQFTHKKLRGSPSEQNLFVFSIWFKCLLYISIILGLRKYNKVVFSVIQSIRNTQITYVSSPPVKTFFFLSVVYLLEVGTELIKLIYANWWIISISIILQDIFIFLKYKWISKWYSR